MAIRAHPQDDQIELRRFRLFRREDSSQLCGVSCCSLFGVRPFCRQAVEILEGDWCPIEQRGPDHPIVALRMVRWDASLINLKQVDSLPRDAERCVRQQLVESPRRRTARERRGEERVVRHPCARQFSKPRRCRAAQLFQRGKHADFRTRYGAVSHQPSALSKNPPLKDLSLQPSGFCCPPADAIAVHRAR